MWDADYNSAKLHKNNANQSSVCVCVYASTHEEMMHFHARGGMRQSRFDSFGSLIYSCNW